jgi:hypothetical protein
MALNHSSTIAELWAHVHPDMHADVMERFAMMADNNYLVRDGKPVIVNGKRVEFLSRWLKKLLEILKLNRRRFKPEGHGVGFLARSDCGAPGESGACRWHPCSSESNTYTKWDSHHDHNRLQRNHNLHNSLGGISDVVLVHSITLVTNAPGLWLSSSKVLASVSVKKLGIDSTDSFARPPHDFKTSPARDVQIYDFSANGFFARPRISPTSFSSSAGSGTGSTRPTTASTTGPP